MTKGRGDATPALTADAAAARYSALVGEEFVVVGPLAGGETGATEIGSGRGVHRVLKWEADPQNITGRLDGLAVAERLRTEAHWPVPVQHAVTDGPWLFVAQELMVGTPITTLGPALVDDLLALHPSRLGLAEPDPTDRWGIDQIEILVSGGHDYCLHEPLRRYDHRTRRLVERIESIGAELSPEQLRGTDLVHADLHLGNLLQVGGRLSAVVDLDYATCGDAAFDLILLAVGSLDAPCDEVTRHRLMEAAVGGLDEAKRQAYVANLLLRLLDWPIRKHRPEEIEFWLARADALLDGSCHGPGSVAPRCAPGPGGRPT